MEENKRGIPEEQAGEAGSGESTAAADISWDDVRELARMLTENGLAEIEWRQGGDTVRLSRRAAVQTVHMAPVAHAAPAGKAVSAPASAGEAPEDEGLVPITAPMTGVFYASPSPDDEPFVAEGDMVEEGDTVCLLEAMKIFNELIAEVSGRVARIAVSNGELVKTGQVLFLIEPD